MKKLMIVCLLLLLGCQPQPEAQTPPIQKEPKKIVKGMEMKVVPCTRLTVETVKADGSPLSGVGLRFRYKNGGAALNKVGTFTGKDGKGDLCAVAGKTILLEVFFYRDDQVKKEVFVYKDNEVKTIEKEIQVSDHPITLRFVDPYQRP